MPVTFRISMFAVGKAYSDGTVKKIVNRLLKVPPARRQPEAMHA